MKGKLTTIVFFFFPSLQSARRFSVRQVIAREWLIIIFFLLSSFLAPSILAACRSVTAPAAVELESKNIQDVFDEWAGLSEYPYEMYERDFPGAYSEEQKKPPHPLHYRKRPFGDFLVDNFGDNVKRGVKMFFLFYCLYLFTRSILWAISNVIRRPEG